MSVEVTQPAALGQLMSGSMPGIETALRTHLNLSVRFSHIVHDRVAGRQVEGDGLLAVAGLPCIDAMHDQLRMCRGGCSDDYTIHVFECLRERYRLGPEVPGELGRALIVGVGRDEAVDGRQSTEKSRVKPSHPPHTHNADLQISSSRSEGDHLERSK